MKVYTVVDGKKTVTYTGFNKRILHAEKIAFVQVEDTYEVFAIDDGKDSLAGLETFLETMGFYYKLIGIFSKEKGE